VLELGSLHQRGRPVVTKRKNRVERNEIRHFE
jgi:hypothetical protein